MKHVEPICDWCRTEEIQIPEHSIDIQRHLIGLDCQMNRDMYVVDMRRYANLHARQAKKSALKKEAATERNNGIKGKPTEETENVLHAL